jgi:AraC-like DNA-binding protein
VVDRLWAYEGALPHRYERLLPSGKPQLLVNLHEDELRTYEDAPARPEKARRVGGAGVPTHDDDAPAQRVQRIGGAGLAGVYDRSIVIDTASQRAVLGASLTDVGGLALLGSRGSAEAHVDLCNLWGADGALWRERLLDAPDATTRLATLEHLLAARAIASDLAPDDLRRMQPASDELGQASSVGALCRQLGASERSFRRHVKRWLGIGPKRYARVRRFGRVLTAIEHRSHEVAGGIDWAGLAADTGHFDQAHLIGEFATLGGMTPTAYRARAPGDRHHVVL